MRVGVMGGTFDPIHLGHLRAAENAREALRLERVVFVPVGAPPHRSLPLSSAFDRFAMACLATADNPAFGVSDLEVSRPGPSYTVDTLERLAAELDGAELFLIVGSDAYAEMETWKDLQRLLSLCRVAVVERPAENGNARRSTALGAEVEAVRGPGLAISASTIRHRVAAGHSIRYLVTDGVAAHVAKRGLYR